MTLEKAILPDDSADPHAAARVSLLSWKRSAAYRRALRAELSVSRELARHDPAQAAHVETLEHLLQEAMQLDGHEPEPRRWWQIWRRP